MKKKWIESICRLLYTILLYAIFTNIQADEVCSVPQQASPSIFSMRNTTTEAKIKQSALYLKANYLQESGNYFQALKTYNYLFSLNASEYIYEGYLRLLSQANQFHAIVRLIDKTEHLFEDDVEIQLIYAQSLLNTNKSEQAKLLLSKLKEKYPENEQILYYITALHEKTNNFSRALADIDAFLAKNEQRTKHAFFYFLKAKIHLKQENPKLALEAINKSLGLHSKFDKAILFKALLLEQMNKIDEAIESYTDFINIAGDNPSIIKQLVQLLFSRERFKEAAQQLKKIEHSKFVKDYSPEYYFDVALLEWKAKNHNEALHYAEKALRRKIDFSKAKLLTIQILLDNKDKQKRDKEILHRASQWLKQSPNDNPTIHMLLMLTQKDLNPRSVLKMFEKSHEKNKKQSNLPLAMADLYLKTKQYEKALSYYGRVSDLTQNEDLKAKISFQTALIYFKKNNKKRAMDKLKKALQKKIIYPPSYNLMAYLLAQSGKQLDNALLLIEKALNYDAQSPEFLDTKGLIFLKQKKQNLAIKTFEQALSYAPNDETIQKHLNDAKTD